MNNGEKIGYAILLLLLLVVIFAIISQNQERERIKRNARYSIAKVKELKSGGAKSSDVIEFEFHYQQEVVLGKESVSNRFKVKNKSFLVVFNSKNPFENELLINESQFEFYNLTCPDSIKNMNLKKGVKPRL